MLNIWKNVEIAEDPNESKTNLGHFLNPSQSVRLLEI